MAQGSKVIWEQNEIQFPRLLAEIWAVGLSDTQYQELQLSMDLEREEIDELFSRADDAFETIKASVIPMIELLDEIETSLPKLAWSRMAKELNLEGWIGFKGIGNDWTVTVGFYKSYYNGAAINMETKTVVHLTSELAKKAYEIAQGAANG